MKQLILEFLHELGLHWYKRGKYDCYEIMTAGIRHTIYGYEHRCSFHGCNAKKYSYISLRDRRKEN